MMLTFSFGITAKGNKSKKTKKTFVSFIKFNNFAALKNVGKY